MSPALVAVIDVAIDYVQHRKSQKNIQNDIDARNCANATVIKMFLDGEIRGIDEFKREWDFAYMTHRIDD
jgi:hypothetical protein